MKTEGRSGNDDDTAGDAEPGAPAPPPSLAGISLFDEAAEPKPRRGKPAPPREPRDAKAERSEPAPKLAPEEPALPEPKRTARRLKLTREGKYYLGITLGVGFAAINTGNNLLYLLLGMLLSLIVVSGVMSELSLQKLSVTRRLPLRAQVGRAHLVEIEVFNHKGKVPSYAIEVEDLRAGQPADKRCFFLKISPTSAQVAAYRRTPARRGRDHHTGFRIATRFPFGLFEKSREVRAPGDLIIYPAVDPVRLPIEQGSRNGNSGRVVGRGGGDDIYTVRPMRQGDDPRDIYWRKSAGMPQLVLRDRVREARPDVELVLDVIRPGQPSAEFANGFERRVRELASRGVAHLKRGDSVVVRTSLGQRASASRSTGADPVLRFLALVEPVDEKDAATAKGAAGRPALPPAPKQTNGAASKSAEAGSA